MECIWEMGRYQIDAYNIPSYQYIDMNFTLMLSLHYTIRVFIYKITSWKRVEMFFCWLYNSTSHSQNVLCISEHVCGVSVKWYMFEKGSHTYTFER